MTALQNFSLPSVAVVLERDDAKVLCRLLRTRHCSEFCFRLKTCRNSFTHWRMDYPFLSRVDCEQSLSFPKFCGCAMDQAIASDEAVTREIHGRRQSRTQSPLAFWSADGRQQRLWGTGILLPQDFCGKTMEVVAGQPIKNFFFFRIPQSLYWRPSADQKARGLWVRDWGAEGDTFSSLLPNPSSFAFLICILFRHFAHVIKGKK